MTRGPRRRSELECPSTPCRVGPWLRAFEAAARSQGSVEGGSVDELLDVAVERPVLDQLEVEVGRTLEDRFRPGLTADGRKKRQLEVVHQGGGHQRPVQRQAAVRAQRYLGLLLEAGHDLDGIATH